MDMAANDISKAQLIGHISAADETKAKELAEEFDFEYAYASDITKKSKYSVSELKHDSMVEKYDSTEREAERPKFLLEEKETYVRTLRGMMRQAVLLMKAKSLKMQQV